MKVLLLFTLIFMKDVCKAESYRTITHEDIKDAILSMVHLFRDTTDKLERHELRERQLGEQLKKALSSLDKRERAQDHVLNGIVAKLNLLEDKIRKIESNTQQDEAAKGAYVVDSVPLQSWMTNMEGMLNKQSVSNDLLSNKEKLEAMEAAYNSKIDLIKSLIEKLESEILNTSAKMSSLFDQQREHQSIEHKKWHGSIISQMESHSNRLAHMHYNKGNNGSINEEALSKTKEEIMVAVNSGMEKLERKLDELDYSLETEEQNVVGVLAKTREMMIDFFHTVYGKFDKLMNEVNALEKVEKILIDTDENIIDTKRKIEFMILQLIQGIEDSLSGQSKNLNDTINDRFDKLSDKIVDNENISVTNISNRLESEMDQVWRQISMLYTQLIESSTVLKDLQNQTQIYVNESTSKMNKMDSRIDAINTHVSEIHENVNYFMGRLSLVTQEFNQTRNALATVVDNLKIDLDKPRDDKDLGPGPIPIDSNHDPSLDNRL